MRIVHLFVSYAHVNLCHFSHPPGVRGWLRLLLVALPGLLCLPFYLAHFVSDHYKVRISDVLFH